MLRRAAVLSAGIAMTAGVGLTGASEASATSPLLHMEPGLPVEEEINGRPD